MRRSIAALARACRPIKAGAGASSADPVARLAHQHVEETLRVSRTEAERSIGRCRLGIAAFMCLLSLVMEPKLHSWEPLLFWGIPAVIAGALLFAVRKLGAPLWLSLLAITLDLAVPIVYFTAFTDTAALSESDIRWYIYFPPALLWMYLGVNQLRTSKTTAIYGGLLSIALFLYGTSVVGRDPSQYMVCVLMALAGLAGFVAADRARRNLLMMARLQLLRQYVPEGAVQRVLDESLDKALAVGGRNAQVTVLASDLRGFTAMSARLAPEEVVTQLNEFHGLMLEQVRRHGGTLDKFIGDGMLAVFGLSLDAASPRSSAQAALSCARGMLAALDGLNRSRAARGEDPLAVGIGIHSGPIVAGAIGAPGHRLEFTVLGDAVNTASRLETATKQLKTPILVSGAAAELIGTGALRPLGAVELRGKPEPVAVFAPL